MRKAIIGIVIPMALIATSFALSGCASSRRAGGPNYHHYSQTNSRSDHYK